MPQKPQIDVDQLDPVEIRKLTVEELRAASTILAHGMSDNPLHVSVFGDISERRRQRLSRFLGPLIAYVHSNGNLLGAYVHEELIGVLGMIQPDRCRPPLSVRFAFGLHLLTNVPPTVLFRIYRWVSAWQRHDTVERHWHIGPLAVLPKYRRRGIGRRLMMACCQRMDAIAETAWLETDLKINVTFYQTLGFVVVRKERVLGVPIWFMIRPPMNGSSLKHLGRKK